MNFIDYLQQKKPQIDKEIVLWLDEQEKEYSSVGYFSKDVFSKLNKFAVGGKSLRGSLSMFSAEMFEFKDKASLVKIAGCLEMIHAGLLVHDDIMDDDLLRRGKPSIFAQYLALGNKKKFDNPLLFGQSMGICIGSLCSLLSLKMISETNLEPALKNKVICKINDEIAKVYLAQMDDVYFGSLNSNPSWDQIEEIYLHKTSGYTFCLPLSVGAIVAGKDMRVVKNLFKLGESIGIVFQIKDDLLAFFSNEKTIGKPVGTDIKSNKKTLLRFLLYQKSNTKEKRFLDFVFGNKKIKISEIGKLRKLAEKYRINKGLERIIEAREKACRKIIEKLAVSRDNKEILLSLVGYVWERKK